MSGRPRSLRKRQAPSHHVWRSQTRNDEQLLSEVREHCLRGAIVHVVRVNGDTFQIIENGTRFLVRCAGGEPLATCDTVFEAVAAGDNWVQRDSEEDDVPGGAA